MKRKALNGRLLLALSLVISSASLAIAQNFDDIREDRPDIIRSFRLIPRKSTLEKTGGFAGVHFEYNLFGKFDIVTGFEPSPLAIYPPVYVPFAKFEDVRVAALLSDPAVDAAFVPLDRFVDLEKLWGTFRPAEPHRLYFKGEDQQGEPFHLLAVQRGPLVHLLGESREQCCDFFHYKIDALAHVAPYADFDLDGMVDRNDLDRLLANIGMSANASLEDGDADGDGDVDGNDFLTWQRQVGVSVNLAEFAGDSLDDTNFAASAVPEPAALTLVLTCVALLTIWRRRP